MSLTVDASTKPVEQPTAADKPLPPKKPLFSNWTWTQIAKYSLGATALTLAAPRLIPQLWAVAQQAPQVASTVYTFATNGIPAIFRSFLAATSVSAAVVQGVGKGVALLRTGASYLGETAPVPTSSAEEIALGGEAAGIAAVFATVSAVNYAVFKSLGWLLSSPVRALAAASPLAQRVGVIGPALATVAAAVGSLYIPAPHLVEGIVEGTFTTVTHYPMATTAVTTAAAATFAAFKALRILSLPWQMLRL